MPQPIGLPSVAAWSPRLCVSSVVIDALHRHGACAEIIR
jgi:hypothetical protein